MRPVRWDARRPLKPTRRCTRRFFPGRGRKGLFAGLALEGATLRQDLDDNATLYGKKLENRQIVTTAVRPPKAAAKLMALLNKYSARENTSYVNRLQPVSLARKEQQMNQMKLNRRIPYGVRSAIGPTAAVQDENAARMAAGRVPIYRVTVTDANREGNQLPAPQRRHQDRFPRNRTAGRSARGEAKVESKQGYIEIEVEFDDLQPATKHGAEYLTYVLWAITPEGRTSNLGEILLNGTKSKLDVTTELQVFGLVVTAEPYYAVTRPSDLIVMENVVRADTKGKIEEIDAKYELLQRGQYQRLANPLALKLDQKMPLELYEARNAVQIARAVGADRFATETFRESREEPGRRRKPTRRAKPARSR